MYRLTNEILLIHSLVSYLKKKEKKEEKKKKYIITLELLFRGAHYK